MSQRAGIIRVQLVWAFSFLGTPCSHNLGEATMSNRNRYTISIRETERTKLRALREDYVRLATDKAYKRRVIEEARARDAEWGDIKAGSHQLRLK
jgi:hypothetical protein